MSVRGDSSHVLLSHSRLMPQTADGGGPLEIMSSTRSRLKQTSQTHTHTHTHAHVRTHKHPRRRIASGQMVCSVTECRIQQATPTQQAENCTELEHSRAQCLVCNISTERESKVICVICHTHTLRQTCSHLCLDLSDISSQHNN